MLIGCTTFGRLSRQARGAMTKLLQQNANLIQFVMQAATCIRSVGQEDRGVVVPSLLPAATYRPQHVAVLMRDDQEL
jgi:hypothetical protein